jgi:hypothetical protein
VRAVALIEDLLILSRIEVAAERAGVPLAHVDAPAQLPPAAEVDLLLVDCSQHVDTWGRELAAWRSTVPVRARPRIVAFGPHTDVAAHRALRAVGLGPMWARSRLVRELPDLFAAATA